MGVGKVQKCMEEFREYLPLLSHSLLYVFVHSLCFLFSKCLKVLLGFCHCLVILLLEFWFLQNTPCSTARYKFVAI